MTEIALYRALVSAGATEAEAQAAVADLACAQDVVKNGDLTAALAQLETRMETQRAQMEVRLIRWMVGVVGLAATLALAVAGLLF